MDSLIYLYGLIPSEEVENNMLPSMMGFDGNSDLYTVPIGRVTAVVCDIDAEQHTEERIKDLINNDMEWLQEKAFHHHETVKNLSMEFTVIPLKFCTIYKNEDSLKSSIQSNEIQLMNTIDSISGKEEWNLKIYCDDQQLKQRIAENHPVIEGKKAEISTLPKGRQFFEKKKIEKMVESLLEEEKNSVSEKIHQELVKLTDKGAVKNAWNKDVTGRKEQMTWNSVYLIPREDVESFLEKIEDIQKEMQVAGWQFEPTGPWPAYHFSSVT
jgi:hypothetical protein